MIVKASTFVVQMALLTWYSVAKAVLELMVTPALASGVAGFQSSVLSTKRGLGPSLPLCPSRFLPSWVRYQWLGSLAFAHTAFELPMVIFTLTLF